MVRLPISCRLPDGYKEDYFAEFLDFIKKETCITDKDGIVSVKGYCNAWIIEKNGKKFNISVVAMFGMVKIEIRERSTSASSPKLP